MKREDINPEFLTELCRGNASAAEFVRQAVEWFHGIDDLVDEAPADELKRRKDLVAAFAAGMVVLSHDYYLRNLAALRPTLLQISQLYAVSVEWELAAEDWKRQWAEHQRHCGIELLVAVAMLCGGWNHAQAMTKKIFEPVLEQARAEATTVKAI